MMLSLNSVWNFQKQEDINLAITPIIPGLYSAYMTKVAPLNEPKLKEFTAAWSTYYDSSTHICPSQTWNE
jgi:hypothetical protein